MSDDSTETTPTAAGTRPNPWSATLGAGGVLAVFAGLIVLTNGNGADVSEGGFSDLELIGLGLLALGAVMLVGVLVSCAVRWTPDPRFRRP
ncbi:MAG TPA: hypothetical protein VGD67_04790 [Pseudonocardiaceae bacterium]